MIYLNDIIHIHMVELNDNNRELVLLLYRVHLISPPVPHVKTACRGHRRPGLDLR